jgi:hypothetical protein
VYVKVKNTGNEVWPALPGKSGLQLLLGNHWINAREEFNINDDGRSVLMFDVAPQAEVELPLTITAPPIVGEFTLEIDMLQEGVSWFAVKDSKTLKTQVTLR